MDKREHFTHVTREELYDLVWQAPLSKVCKEFGISDKGLSKVCVRHSIPTPGLGYWRRLERGFSVKRIALPIQERPLVITIRRHPIQGIPKRGNKVEINVPERLSNPHYLIKAFRENQKAPSPHFDAPSQATRLWFRCSPASLPRLIRILDTIFKELESRGYKMELSRKGNPAASRDGENVEFRLDEISSSPGHLALRIGSYGNGLRLTWRDGAKQRVEKMLSDFLYNVDQLCLQMKKRSEERERDRIEWERRQEEQRIFAQRESLLLKELERIERIEKIDKYTTALRTGSIQIPANLDAWLEWVASYVKRLSTEPIN